MSNRREHQHLLMRLLPALITKALQLGYEVTLGDGYRDPRVFGDVGTFKGYGNSRSNHKKRLAIDLNLFKDGEYLRTTADHAELGAFWESLHPACRWGGRFHDGNHYEVREEVLL